VTSSTSQITLVLVTHNSAQVLPRCLDSIFDPSREDADRPSDVVVVDNASRDETLGVAGRYPVTRLPQRKNLGYAKAANRGLDEIRTEYALLANPDVWFPSDCFRELERFMSEHPDCEVQGPRLEDDRGELLLSCRTFPTWRSILGRRLGLFPDEVATHLMRDYDHETPRRVDWVSGACLLFPAAYRFDPGYFLYVEDVDFCSGRHVYYNPQAIARHSVQRASKRNPRLMFIHLLSMMRFMRKRR